MSTQPEPKLPYVTTATGSLKKKLGTQYSLRSIFTAEKIEECQAIINEAYDELLEKIQAEASDLAMECSKTENDRVILQTATLLAEHSKKAMETIGYSLGFSVASSLLDYIHTKPAASSNTSLVIGKHLHVLQVILKNKIRNDGGELGKEMLAGLHKLVQKMAD